MSTGRKKDPLWEQFIELPASSSSAGGKTPRVECKHCKKNLVGLVARMRSHLMQCSEAGKSESGTSTSKVISTSTDTCEGGVLEIMDDNDEPVAKKNKKGPSSMMSTFVVKTTEKEKDKLDVQVAKYIFATNTSFRNAEHPEFVKMMKMARPGYTPPNRKIIAGKLLDEVHDSVKSMTEHELRGKSVCMALDGWSNLRNEPIVCVSVTSVENTGRVYLVDTIDTTHNSHTGEYLLDIAVQSIKKCKSFGCTVRSFVTDNASNMAKMRRQLAEVGDPDVGDIITYGCSAHLLNLFAKDIEEENVKNNIKQVIKYFKYHHFPGAKYKEAGGTALVLPQDVRWNTLADCLESYMKNWHCLAKVCSEHRSAIDLNIIRLVQDLELKERADNYLKKLKKVAVGLDAVQKETCVLSECTQVWKTLISSGNWSIQEADKLMSRYKYAVTPAHFAAYILDPKYKGQGLSEEEDTAGMEFIDSSCSQAMKDVLTYRAMSFPFKDFMFKEELLKKTHVSLWWKSLGTKIDAGTAELTSQLFTATASSAGIERLFSTFGLVHSKLRNQLGTPKAAKLVTIMRMLNPHQHSQNYDDDSD